MQAKFDINGEGATGKHVDRGMSFWIKNKKLSLIQRSLAGSIIERPSIIFHESNIIISNYAVAEQFMNDFNHVS